MIPMAARLKTDICRAYGLVFRAPNNLGNVRHHATPDSHIILSNINSFERRFSSIMWNGSCILNSYAKNAIKKIKAHIVNGCLSHIPAHVSTSGNERLHRHLNYIFQTNKIGMDTAYIRCSRLFYKLNTQDSGDVTAALATSANINSESVDISKRSEHFGFEDFTGNDEELVSRDKVIVMYEMLNKLTTDNINEIKNIILSYLSYNGDEIDDHAYFKIKDSEIDNRVELTVAHTALKCFQIYRNLEDLGASKLFQKSNIPQSIGLSNQFREMSAFTSLNNGDMASHKLTLAGHLQGFGLEEIEVQGDGNCFFTAVAFQLSNLFSATSIEENISHLRRIGLTGDMNVQELSHSLRHLLVEEWRGDMSLEYASFLPDNV